MPAPFPPGKDRGKLRPPESALVRLRLLPHPAPSVSGTRGSTVPGKLDRGMSSVYRHHAPSHVGAPSRRSFKPSSEGWERTGCRLIPTELRLSLLKESRDALLVVEGLAGEVLPAPGQRQVLR